MPGAGMTWKSDNVVTTQLRRDRAIARALHAKGYSTRNLIDGALVKMFETASSVFLDNYSQARKEIWSTVTLLQAKLDWAQSLNFTTFYDFFCCLVKARYQFERVPVYPYFNYDRYQPSVIALVQFRRAVKDCPQIDIEEGVDEDSSWILTDAGIYDAVEGFEDDGNDDDAMDVDLHIEESTEQPEIDWDQTNLLLQRLARGEDTEANSANGIDGDADIEMEIEQDIIPQFEQMDVEEDL
ncbi:hypothetical protein F5Y16DRAFT_316371 [Xylariaceae sp. FL0255]|nr:hypothetical protein F5Y16DRAFT_316371 [Xylariaceae sp. FL0255]